MDRTKIEWADATWNPITGCSPVSAGCLHCYARRMALRLANRFGYPAENAFAVAFHRDRLSQPREWKKPRRIFVCSMGDLWHPDVASEDRAAVIRATNLAPQHTYIFCTKRPERIREDFSGCPNFWILTSVEDQPAANVRIPQLLKVPAMVRGISCEPLLGPVSFRWAKWSGFTELDDGTLAESHLDGLRGIHWIVAGGETGPGSRPAHPAWFRTLRNQAAAANVPFFFKSWGDWSPPDNDTPRCRTCAIIEPTGRYLMTASGYEPGCPVDHRLQDAEVVKVGKQTTGRLLDRREHNDFPPIPNP